MNRGTDLCSGLVSVVVKLRTLRDSCRGIARTRQYPPDFSWFEGAAAICQEAIDRLKETIGVLEKSKE
ncbi:MAG: hypothetical protein ACLFVT_09015 [Syntrophobacteria bacterium]